MSPIPYAFLRGEYVPLSEAKVGIMTHALHYGTGIFEGIRGNWNEEKGCVYIFRMREHYERLLRGCRLLMLDIPYSAEDLCNMTVEVVERSGFAEDVYIRPLAYKSAERVANLKLQDLDSDFCLMAVPFGNYLGSDTLRCCTSSWRRVDDSMMPARFKISGIYVNSILAKTEATLAGFDEAIILNQDGHVCEGSGENVFLVVDGKLITPPIEDNVLPGITRSTVIQLAQSELGLEVIETHIDRSQIYIADECFLTGTAAHVTPVIEVDSRKIAHGKTGPISAQIQKLYFEVVGGKVPKYIHWCTSATPRLVGV